MPKSVTAKERSKKRSVYVFTALGLVAGIAVATLTHSGDSKDRSAAPAAVHAVTVAADETPQVTPAYIPGWQIPGWQGPPAAGAASQSI
ncbi:hypothetical protein AB0D97_29410 [Streptomyces roseus]|uniref:hypothetical protein n=1 Tax=Streptomyces roseus TaxID=66430 RepID=UPI0033C658F7